ncbi:MAG: ferrous iron transport protein A [Firmicutes bacterium]|nr:ferrous iron transport protein A [Bacillota bacterium]
MAFAQERQGRHRHKYRWGWRWGRGRGPAGKWAGGQVDGRRGATPGRPGLAYGLRLCDLGPGEEAEIAFVDAHSMRDLQKFVAMGVLPGARVKLIQRIPVCVFRIGESEFAIDGELSRTIYLKA